jgi:transcriptional regulator with XRE-family HTH domain
LEADAPTVVDQEVGARLRSIRQRFGLSQRELARRAGVTNGTVSLIEQGQVSPSIGSLRRLTGALSLTLAEFFGVDIERLGASTFFRADELPEIGSGHVSLRRVGSKARQPRHQILHERYPPGADTGEELLSHPGEEGGVVTRGQILVTVGSEERVLKTGDAYYFDSRIPHRFRNPGSEECEIVSAASQASL